MKVHHFSTFPYGGAAIAAKRLHVELLQQNTDSRFLYYLNDREPPQFAATRQLESIEPHSTAWPPPLAKWLDKKKNRRVRNLYEKHITGRAPELETFSMAEQLRCANLDLTAVDADVVHLHWVAFMADYPIFFQRIPQGKPIVWTLHDMNPFTGGCHFTSGCQRFIKGCGNCPQIQNPQSNDVSAISYQVKRKTLASRQHLTVVAPSRWLLNEAQRSPLWPVNTNFQQIKYGLDSNSFRPQEKSSARMRLGLPIGSVVVGFGADNLSNPRKGLALLEQALSLSPSSRTHLTALIFGAGKVDAASLCVHNVLQLGFLSSEAKQVDAYNACDFFVVPSLADNQPQTALEAMACGVPVIAFDSGGIGEVVKHGENGLLAAPDDLQGLANAIEKLILGSDLRRQLAQGARMSMLREHEGKAQALKYLGLYEKISSRHA